jgi:hypothetical protein
LSTKRYVSAWGWFCTWKLRGHQIKSEIYIEDMILLDTHGTWWG